MLNKCHVCKTEYRVLYDDETEQYFRLACPCEMRDVCRHELKGKKCSNKAVCALLEGDGSTVDSFRCPEHVSSTIHELLQDALRKLPKLDFTPWEKAPDRLEYLQATDPDMKVVCDGCKDVHAVKSRTTLILIRDKKSGVIVHRTLCPACEDSGFFHVHQPAS